MQETLEQVGVIDMALTEEAGPRDHFIEGGCLSLPPRSAHICTLKVVDRQDAYVVALQARCARLTLYKVDADLGLSIVCDLPFQEWDVAYKNHEPILQVCMCSLVYEHTLFNLFTIFSFTFSRLSDYHCPNG